MTLKRSPMPRPAFITAKPRKHDGEAKPVKGPKLPRCAVKGCRKPFVKERSHITWCSLECAEVIAMAVVVKQRAKVERDARAAAKRERMQEKIEKSAREPLQVKLDRLQTVVNSIVRLRDRFDGCISCDKPAHWAAGEWHASHYKSVGSNSALRFNFFNLHKACSQCNWHQAGNIGKYKVRLEIKIGAERLDWLDCHPRSRDYAPQYLDRAYVVACKWLKRKRAAKDCT